MADGWGRALGLACLALWAGGARAAPVVIVGIETDGPEATAVRAAAQGERPVEVTDRALARAEQAFLELDYATAEAELTQVVNDALGRPEQALDAERSFGAALRLVQVHLAGNRPDAANRVLRQCVGTWPGFPGRLTPPPDVTRLLDQATARLRGGAPLGIRSQPSGRLVRLNGVAVGTTPVEVPGFAGRGARACIDGPTGTRCAIAAGSEILITADAPAARARLADSLFRGDEATGWQALGELQVALGESAACVVRVQAGDVTVARLDGTARSIAGGDRVARPSGPMGWRAVGGHCLPGVGGAPPEVLRAALWAPLDPAGGLDARTLWGFGTAGAGVATAALGVGFGLSARAAAEDFNRTGDPAAEDRALGRALVADVAFVGAAALVGVGLYLLLFD